ncbi:Fur family ferric uptake transcriptional regulator [Natranaerovirga hydrolytica]|uniref:Fur family ferric uptake transcriptional regulator n=1 Tax=Natranaerovirga hydrolytica TaxID=680378 RepID=A0A4R1MYL1_9FIRM|nr:transcriptional repressor [Natranaerovirga hydrolytica]TCK98388.1 Fur family ferric uptake transcriptional regulator [Natranaerovirga hydrolytica]
MSSKDSYELKKKLKEKGLKLTTQRRTILEILEKHEGEHLTAEEIYELVKVDCPEIGLATVYRTVQLLLELDLIEKLNLDDGFVRYEIGKNDNEHHHHHLICNTCGKVYEVEDDLLDNLEDEIEKTFKFKVTDHKVKFYGVCEKCTNDN